MFVPPKTDMIWKIQPFESMYFLLKMVIYNVMLVFRGVNGW